MQERTVERKNWIDAAKAIAIFVVVLNHSGLVIRGVNFWGGMFFVPAFFVLSGYTYHVSTDSFGSFLKRKAKRILLPYLAANLFLFLFYFCFRLYKKTMRGAAIGRFVLTSFAGMLYGRNCLFPDRRDKIMLMVNLNAPLWFLPALFAALIFTEGLFRLFHGNEKKILAVIAGYALAGVGYHYFFQLLLPWCLDMMPFFMLMMYVGFRLKKMGVPESCADIPKGKRILTVSALLLVLIVSGLLNGSVNLSLSDTGKSVTLMLFSAVSSSILLMLVTYLSEQKLAGVTAVLAGVGRHTLTILCYHYFILRMMLDIFVPRLTVSSWETGDDALWILYRIVCMVVSIALCIALDLFSKKLKNGMMRKNHAENYNNSNRI